MLLWVDVLLVLGLTLRLTRLVTVDDVGEWFLRRPANTWAGTRGWRLKLTGGLECPFCIGFWIGVLCLLSLWAVGGPGDADEWWRWVAGAFTLNWVAAHVGARMGDS